MKYFDTEELKERTPMQYFSEAIKRCGFEYLAFPVREITRVPLMKVFKKDRVSKGIPIMLWVRPISLSLDDVSRHLLDYPRLNLPKKIIKMPEEKRIPAVFDLCKKNKVYFLVILPRATAPDLYWLGRYQDFPLSYWTLGFRKDKDVLDRVRFNSKFHGDFINEKELKLRLKTLLK